MLVIRYQLSTLSALDLDCVHHLPHALLQEKDMNRAPAACPLQIQDLSYRSNQIDGCYVCRGPLIEVKTPPAMAIATASVSVSFR